MLGTILLAVAAKSAGVYGSSSYQAYRSCLAETVKEAARAQTTPEDLQVTLRGACADQHAQFGDDIARHAGRPDTDDGTAADAREVEARTGELLDGYTRRYAVYYATGVWPKQ